MRTESLLASIEAKIREIESGSTPPQEQFSPSRYPYTYGWDYMRLHADEFGWNGQGPSRGQVAS